MNDEYVQTREAGLPEHYEGRCDADVLLQHRKIASLHRLRQWCAPMTEHTVALLRPKIGSSAEASSSDEESPSVSF
jgi:hypothetical protein